jgi:hypothetical protein
MRNSLLLLLSTFSFEQFHHQSSSANFHLNQPSFNLAPDLIIVTSPFIARSPYFVFLKFFDLGFPI